MEEQFISYELAKRLKELGFNKPCFGWWFGDGSSPEPHYEYQQAQDDIRILAPTYQQAIDWLREKHEVYVFIVLESTGDDEECYSYEIRYEKNPTGKRIYNRVEWIRSFTSSGSSYSGGWDHYYEAMNMAISASILLIKS